MDHFKSQLCKIDVVNTFPVNYKQGQDARLDKSGQYDLASNCSLVALSPNAEVLVTAAASTLQFFSTFTGELDYTIENISNGIYINLPRILHR